MSAEGGERDRERAGELDDPIAPRDALTQLLWMSFELELILYSAITYRCGPFRGPIVIAMVFGVAPLVTVPVTAVVVGLPALVMMLVLRGAKRAGSRRAWRRFHGWVIDALLATIAVAAVAGLSADPSACAL